MTTTPATTRVTATPAPPGRPRRARVAALVAGALALTTAAACSADGATSSTTAPDRTLEVYSANIDTLDPRQTHGVVSRALADSLLDIDPETQEYVPWLATSYEVNETQTEFTFVLREDVTFSDGTPLDAETIRANLDAAAKQVVDGFGWYIRGIFDNYVETVVVDEHTATVRFSEPNPSFLPTVPTAFLAILSPDSLAKDYEERQAGGVVGTGPYVIETYTPNEGVVLQRREDYAWASDLSPEPGPARIATVDVSFVDEQSVRENALLAGEVQLAQNPTIEGAQLLTDQGFDVYSRAQVGNPYSFVFNFARPLTRDVAVRRALAKVIDRDTIQASITTDREPASTSILTPGTSGYADTSAQIEYDPREATQILDDAGWVLGPDGVRVKDGQRLSLTIVNWWEPQAILDTLTYVLESAAAVGIELEIVNEIGGGTTWEEGRADILYQNSTRAEGGHAIYSYYADRYLQPSVGATGAEITEPGTDLNGIVEASFVEPDPVVRADLLAQAQEIVLRDALRVVIFDNVNSESGYFAASSDLRGLRSNSLSELVIADAWFED